MSRRFMLVSMLVVLSLTGCSTSGAKKVPKWVNVTPMSQLVPGNLVTTPDANYSSAYTRLIIIGKTCSDIDVNDECTRPVKRTNEESRPVKSYDDHWWVWRLLFGTRNTITLTSKITAGSFEASVPLITIDHISNTTDGESFTRTVYHTAQNFPFFLVKKDASNAIASMKFSVKASSENKSNVAAAIILTAQNVARLAAPPSAVLTTLTEQSAKTVATAIDNTLSKVLATSVEEVQWTDQDIRYWDDEKGVTVRLSIPQEGFFSWNLDDEKFPFLTLGEWTLKFESPRPSIFSDAQICKKEAGEPAVTQEKPALTQDMCRDTISAAAMVAQQDTDKRADEVLAFNFINGLHGIGTVSSYLKQQDWWATSQMTFAKVPDDERPKNNDVRSFCHSIKSTIVGLNLNSVDAGIVAVAVRNSGLVSQNVAKAMGELSEDCGHYTPAVTPAAFTPTTGAVGTVVTVTGTNLAGATEVKFNGMSAGPPTSVTATSLQTTVPTGVTTGTISVVTPNGTATSSGNFTIR